MLNSSELVVGVVMLIASVLVIAGIVGIGDVGGGRCGVAMVMTFPSVWSRSKVLGRPSRAPQAPFALADEHVKKSYEQAMPTFYTYYTKATRTGGNNALDDWKALR